MSTRQTARLCVWMYKTWNMIYTQRVLCIIFSISVLSFFSGCAQTVVYDSSLPPAPLMKQAGEFYIAPSYGGNGVNVNAAVAFFGQFEFTGSILYNESAGDRIAMKDIDAQKQYGDAHMARYYEFAGGIYFPFQEDMVTELFFGTGKGSANDYDYTKEYWDGNNINIMRTESGSYNKIFAQLNIGGHKKYSKSGLALRCSYIDFTDYHKAHSKRGIQSTGNPSGLLWEPSFFVEFGGENIRLLSQIVYPYSPHDIGFGIRNFIFTVGVAINTY